MVDCVDILRSITKSCGDNVGGVNKRVWITQLQQIENYTFDSLGYVNSLVTKENGNTNYPYELKKVISKKGSHSGNVEAIENVNIDVFKHTAILKAYATTPEQRDSLVSLYGASKVVVFFETDNGDIEIYGLENGLYATALTGNTGEQMQDDTAFTFTLSGLQTSLPKYFLYGGSLHTSIAYLDNIGLSPIYEIESYTTGTTPITFTSDGSNGWDVGIIAKPTTVQLPNGQSIDFVNYQIRHYIGGVETVYLNGDLTADDTINTGANGAGAYEVSLAYTLLDGTYFTVNALFVVDATNIILNELVIRGTYVNSVNGLTMDLSADIVDALSMPLTWKAYSGTFTNIGTGKDAVVTLPIGTTDIAIEVALDSAFSDYPDPTYLSVFSVIIS